MDTKMDAGPPVTKNSPPPPVAPVADPKKLVTSKARYPGAGKYNAVALPVVPYEVVKVSDGGKGTLDFHLLGKQQVVGSRDFVPPVVVEYVTKEEHDRWSKAQ